ncbi:MAG: hypothetical protein GY696_15850 [Gammaproteobacteria bacterium]|nr:hypothetical protein [Gammaproteobacteria bacterium]
MYITMITLHLLAAIIWVGGMFFAHMAMRPVLAEQLEPPRRLPILYAILGRFFRWVWLAVILILASGFGVFLGTFGGNMAFYVHLMSAIGVVMALLFSFIYFVPYRRMGRALADGEIPVAGAQMNLIRQIIATNLVLGLITSIVATTKPF